MSIPNIILLILGFKPVKSRNYLRNILNLDTVSFRKWGDVKREEIFNYHKVNTRFYSNFLQGIDGDNWNNIPLMTKEKLRAFDNGLKNHRLERLSFKVGITSGSSGKPLKFLKDKFCHGLTWQGIYHRYSSIGILSNHLQARFYGIPLKSKLYYLERIKDWFFRRRRFVVFDMSDSVLSEYLNDFSKNEYKYIYGYTNSLVLFARYIISNKKNLKRDYCSSLKCCIVTSEQCSSEDKLILEQAFGVNVYNEYGASEIDVIAFSDSNGDWLICGEFVYVEILDEDNNPVEDGQIGKIVVTQLHNRAMPFIRYELGDYGAIERNQYNRYDRLVSLNGRVNDLAILPSGKRVPGFTLYYTARQVIQEINGVVEYQIEQIKIDAFIIYYVSTMEVSQDEEVFIKSTFIEYLEPGLEILVQRVDRIDRMKSGKFKHFISLSSGQE